jgi:hypothetical protein
MNRHTVPLERRRLVRELYGDQDAPLPVPDPEPEETAQAPPSAPPRRCDDCGYLVTAVGHQIICGDTP